MYLCPFGIIIYDKERESTYRFHFHFLHDGADLGTIYISAKEKKQAAGVPPAPLALVYITIRSA
jgi:hypothetical protein